MPHRNGPALSSVIWFKYQCGTANVIDRNKGVAMSRDMGGCLGAIVGCIAGYVIGTLAWILGYYYTFMVPRGIPLAHIDQGAIPSLFTGILGAVTGALALRQLGQRFGR
jgi:hypothetical protein